MPSIKGTSSVADVRARNKALKSTKFPKNFSKSVRSDAVNKEVLTQWIEDKVAALLGFDDEIVSSMAVNVFLEKNASGEKVDPRCAQLDLVGFLGEKEAASFSKELWTMMLEAQSNGTGIPTVILEKKKKEMQEAAAAAAAERAKAQATSNQQRDAKRNDRGRASRWGNRASHNNINSINNNIRNNGNNNNNDENRGGRGGQHRPHQERNNPEDRAGKVSDDEDAGRRSDSRRSDNKRPNSTSKEIGQLRKNLDDLREQRSDKPSEALDKEIGQISDEIKDLQRRDRQRHGRRFDRDENRQHRGGSRRYGDDGDDDGRRRHQHRRRHHDRDSSRDRRNRRRDSRSRSTPSRSPERGDTRKRQRRDTP